MKLLKRIAAIALISVVISSILHMAGGFKVFENKTYDQRMIFASRFKKPCQDIFFVGIDQASIDYAQSEYGWGWPWPREAYARIVDFVSAGKPKAILFDILFTETSVYGEDDDKAFADAEKRSGKVIQSMFVSENAACQVAQFPVKPLMENAASVGNITSLMDEDDIIRRGRLDYNFDGTVYPTLGTAPLYLEGGADFSDIPRLKDGSVLLRYQRNMDSYFPYSARDLLSSYDAWKNGQEGVFLPEDFEDAYVYIACYAPGLFDICSVPVSQVFPGVGVHITTLDNYLTKSFIKKAPEPVVYLWFVIMALFASAGVCIATTHRSQKISVLVMAGVFVAGFALSIGLPYLFFTFGIWLNLTGAFFSFAASFLISVAFSYSVEGRQKRFIKAAFSQCLSKEVVNQILNDPASFTLGGKNYQMSAIFTDIQKFSSFSELLTASQLGCLLNYYLTIMSDIIINEHGTIDKYEGDAIVALVGAPVEMPDHAVRACAAAIKMKKAEIQMNQNIRKIAAGEKPDNIEQDLYDAFRILVQNNREIFTRIGINSGEMIAGYFGSEMKKNYTMMGNNVNLAARLEGVNKQYSTGGILISEYTKKLAGAAFVTRKLDRVRVVNVKTPLRLYELLDDEQASPELKAYAQKWDEAMAEFDSKNYSQALEIFRELKQKNNADRVCDYYLMLVENYFTKNRYPEESDNIGVTFNPQDGVFTLLQK